MQEAAAILNGLVRDVSRYNPRGILLIASNPVDVLTYAAWKWSGLPASRVIGSGTSLEWKPGFLVRSLKSLPVAF
jgi:L-lactate dehydrogenase